MFVVSVRFRRRNAPSLYIEHAGNQRSLRDIKAGGETAAYDAIQVGMDEMKMAKHNKKILLLVTDGFDTKSHINCRRSKTF